MRRCFRCKTEKPFEDFNKHAKMKHGIRSECRSCQAETRKKKRIYLYEFLIKHFKENPCVKCGEKNPILLDFDHLKDKTVCIANAIKNLWSLEKLQDEIDKCQVLCANCHRLKTAKDHNWYMYKKLYESKKIVQNKKPRKTSQ